MGFDVYDKAFQMLIASISAGAGMRGGADLGKIARLQIMWITARENPDLTTFLFVAGLFSGVFATLVVFALMSFFRLIV